MFDLNARSLKAGLEGARESGWWETFQIEIANPEHGPAYESCTGEVKRRLELTVAEKISQEWSDWELECGLAGCPAERCYLVMEDFVPRAKAVTMKREVLLPVRIAAMVEGMLVKRFGAYGGREIIYQTAGYVKGYANDARLRRWGVWVVGSDHQRDAVRHVCARLNTAMRQQ